MASSIPAARTGLLALLTELQATTLEGVHVARTDVWKGPAEHDFIVVGNATEISREYPGVGATRFKEGYLLPVEVEASLAGTDPGALEAVEARAWALLTIVEQTVLANRDLDGLLVHMLPKDIPSGEESGPVSEGRVVARMTLNVDCLAVVQLS